ncbi:MAG: methyltransferase domain-containing protein, partial [Shimia sp.]
MADGTTLMPLERGQRPTSGGREAPSLGGGRALPGGAHRADASSYALTRARVEDYFDRSATKVWEQLTSDAPVSRIRATVRAGRDRMRDLMLSRLPEDLTGARILDAGCGTGAASQALAERGATVVGVDISPSLTEIAAKRMPEHLRDRVTFEAGDMLADRGTFD